MRKRALALGGTAFLLSLLSVLLSTTANAQEPAQQGGPLPPLPSQQPQYAPQQQQYPQQQYPQQPPPPGQPYYPQQQPPPQYGPPPTYYQPQPAPPQEPTYAEPEVPVHAPKYSLYTGLRISYMGWGGSFYALTDVSNETTGNLVTTGPEFELDVGARIAKRYIPFVFIEHAFLGAGRRFDGGSASATTDLLGGGLRTISGDVDSVALVTELTIGKRTVSVSSGGQSWSMSTVEFLKFGVGAEIRITTLFSLSPLAYIGTGQMSDTSGTVAYSPNGSKSDGLTAPPYTNGNSVASASTYIVFGIGVGGHFDVFGK